MSVFVQKSSALPNSIGIITPAHMVSQICEQDPSTETGQCPRLFANDLIM